MISLPWALPAVERRSIEGTEPVSRFHPLTLRHSTLGLSASAVGRLTALAVILVLLKVMVLWELRKHLQETHWRVESHVIGWGDYVAFCGFVALGILSVLQLARDCGQIGIKAVRAANVSLLVLGALFVLLGFHSGDKNYIHLATGGVLSWKDLAPYLKLHFLFGSPFLGFWVFGYGLVYYVLARTGREGLTLYATSIFAAFFAAFYLRELVSCREELVAADCLGLVWLLTSRIKGKPLKPAWLLIPFAGVFFMWALFRGSTPHLKAVDNMFFWYLCGSILLFGVGTWIAGRYGFRQPWFALLPFYFGSFLLLINRHYPVAANYNHLLCLGLLAPHYLQGSLIVMALVTAAAVLFARFWPAARLWWLDVINWLVITISFLDLRVVQIMGVRIDWDVLAFANSPKMVWRMAQPYLADAAAVIGLGTVLYILIARRVRIWVSRRTAAALPGWTGSKGVWHAAATFVLFAVAGSLLTRPDKGEGQAGLLVLKTAPLWKRGASRPMNREEFVEAVEKLRLGGLCAVKPATPGAKRDLNVLLVFMESSYNQHLSLFGSSEQTQPLLSKYRERMEIFPNFFSNFAGSIHARFASFTSLYPSEDFGVFTMRRVPVKSLFEVLQENGYSCSLFDSSFLDYTGFRDFLNQRGLEEMYDADSMPGERKSQPVSWGLLEGETLNAMKAQLAKYATLNQKFFLTYIPAAPHYPYDSTPSQFVKFKPGALGDYTPFYLNSLLYMDWVISSLVDQLKETGLLDNTLVIITNDHGEMLGANGGPIGHGWAITPELVNTPLIFMDPGKHGGQTNYTIGSQVDLLPTVLDRLHIPIPADQLYEGRSLDQPQGEHAPLIYLNSYQQYGLITDKRLFVGERGAARRKCYAIGNEGTRTVFTEMSAEAMPEVTIKRFGEFQENLLRNYAYYCDLLRKSGPVQAASLGRESLKR